MAVEYKRMWCPDCQSFVRAENPKPNNLIHLLLTVITGGLWMIIWMLSSAVSMTAKWQCPQCGLKKLKRKP